MIKNVLREIEKKKKTKDSQIVSNGIENGKSRLLRLILL